MIIGTAGHIDHGKTTLVRALTGVDTDRLPEEKKRGISIELGYAFMEVPGSGERLGFVDVPGHERLVHTMVAGASGIDTALLLVSADDGPMPQTLEHLAVLLLLGVAPGAVVITKTDRADAARLAAVREQMAALLAATSWCGAPIVEVSAHRGEGLDALRALLFEATRQPAANGAEGGADGFRLAIDRAFTLAGRGTIVTGTVHAGSVRVGDELTLLPSTRPTRVRVRSLHAQNQASDVARVGQRCALGLASVPKEGISRGQWLADPAIALATQRLDARCTLWPGEAKALRSGARVQVHLGAARSSATLAVLDAEAWAPGASQLLQLVLHAPLCAWHGERVLLRDASGQRTLAGGVVLDAIAPARYRRTPQRLAQLAALQLPSAVERLRALIDASPQGTDAMALTAAQGLVCPPDGAIAAGAISQAGLVLGGAAAQQISTATLAALAEFHAKWPDELGPDTARLRRLAAPRLAPPLWQALLSQMAQSAQVAVRAGVAHLPTHGAQLSATETRIAQKVAPLLDQAGFEGAWARDLAKDCGESEPLVRLTLARLARRGELHQVVKDLYVAPRTMQRLVGLMREQAAATSGEVRAAAFRDATGLGRKRAIQLLEYFDRIGLTRRRGEAHKLRADCALFS